MDMSAAGGGNIIQADTAIEYFKEPDKQALPKVVRCTKMILMKDKSKAERIDRTEYEFTLHDSLPPERFSLTQFGMAEREPGNTIVDGQTTEGPQPLPGWEKKSYLVEANAGFVPLYVWVTGGGIALLVLGIVLRIWLTRSASTKGTPPPPVTPT